MALKNAIIMVNDNGTTTSIQVDTAATTSKVPLSIDASGNLLSTGGIAAAGFTVATLPAGIRGMRAYVTDALAPSYMVAVVAGGSVVTPVFYNGTNWIAG